MCCAASGNRKILQWFVVEKKMISYKAAEEVEPLSRTNRNHSSIWDFLAKYFVVRETNNKKKRRHVAAASRPPPPPPPPPQLPVPLLPPPILSPPPLLPSIVVQPPAVPLPVLPSPGVKRDSYRMLRHEG